MNLFNLKLDGVVVTQSHQFASGFDHKSSFAGSFVFQRLLLQLVVNVLELFGFRDQEVQRLLSGSFASVLEVLVAASDDTCHSYISMHFVLLLVGGKNHERKVVFIVLLSISLAVSFWRGAGHHQVLEQTCFLDELPSFLVDYNHSEEIKQDIHGSAVNRDTFLNRLRNLWQKPEIYCFGNLSWVVGANRSYASYHSSLKLGKGASVLPSSLEWSCHYLTEDFLREQFTLK